MQRIRSLHERKAATGSPPIIVVMTAAEEELREAAPQPAKRAWIRRRTWRGEPYVGGKRDRIGQSFGAAHPGGHKDRKHSNYDAFCQGGDSERTRVWVVGHLHNAITVQHPVIRHQEERDTHARPELPERQATG